MLAEANRILSKIKTMLAKIDRILSKIKNSIEIELIETN